MDNQKQSPVFIGVDVAKDAVVVAWHGQTGTRSVANAAGALKAWLKTLPQHAHIGVESTGGYHELLARLAHQAGFTLYVLNPRDVHHYGNALGRRAKTDRVDALLLARYIAKEYDGLHPWQPSSAKQQHLDKLIKRRAVLVKNLGALRQTLKHVTGMGAQIKVAFKALEGLIKAIDAQIKIALASEEHTLAASGRVRSVPGIGLLSAAALVNLFERFPKANSDAMVAFSGLDPRPKDSGNKQGLRSLSKRGPAELRRLLYNAAMSAARTKVWQPYYERELSKGLPCIAALVCLARRLLRTAFALYRTSTRFDPLKAKIA